MNRNYCEKTKDHKHVMVYSTRRVWGGGSNVVCAHCKVAFGMSRDEDATFLAECNRLAQEGKLQ